MAQPIARVSTKVQCRTMTPISTNSRSMASGSRARAWSAPEDHQDQASSSAGSAVPQAKMAGRRRHSDHSRPDAERMERGSFFNQFMGSLYAPKPEGTTSSRVQSLRQRGEAALVDLDLAVRRLDHVHPELVAQLHQVEQHVGHLERHGVPGVAGQLAALLLGQPLEGLEQLARFDDQGRGEVLGRVEPPPVARVGKSLKAGGQSGQGIGRSGVGHAADGSGTQAGVFDAGAGVGSPRQAAMAVAAISASSTALTPLTPTAPMQCPSTTMATPPSSRPSRPGAERKAVRPPLTISSTSLVSRFMSAAVRALAGAMLADAWLAPFRRTKPSRCPPASHTAMATPQPRARACARAAPRRAWASSSSRAGVVNMRTPSGRQARVCGGHARNGAVPRETV